MPPGRRRAPTPHPCRLCGLLSGCCCRSISCGHPRPLPPTTPSPACQLLLTGAPEEAEEGAWQQGAGRLHRGAGHRRHARRSGEAGWGARRLWSWGGSRQEMAASSMASCSGALDATTTPSLGKLGLVLGVPGMAIADRCACPMPAPRRRLAAALPAGHAVGDEPAGPRGGHPLPRLLHPRAAGRWVLWIGCGCGWRGSGLVHSQEDHGL